MTPLPSNSPVLSRACQFGVNLLRLLPYGVRSLKRYELDNLPHASNFIRLLDELKIKPAALFDIGARNSEWSRWLKKEWPSLVVHSFDPNPYCQPIGYKWPTALGDREGFVREETSTGFTYASDGYVRVIRFDTLIIDAPSPAILKIDCDQMTLPALLGFGSKINNYAVVDIEMWNHEVAPKQCVNRQPEIWKFMLDNGFNRSRVTDVALRDRRIECYDIAFWKE